METLTFNNEIFKFIKSRTDSYQIYQRNTKFLRIGSEEEIKQELDRHAELSSFEFPIPRILDQGNIGKKSYYLEESMGNIILGKLFGEDYNKNQKISDENFKNFLNISLIYANAQLKSKTDIKNLDEFMKGFYLHLLYQERPDLKDLIDIVFAKVREKIGELPFVLTHGDFNAHNLFPNGIIDLENFHYGSLGYDLVSAVVHPYLFPPISANTESSRTYLFTQEQEEKYFHRMDEIFISNNLKPLTNYLDEFTLCRAVFSCVDMHHRPLMQKWRYDLLEELMRRYVEGERLEFGIYRK